MTTPYLLLDHVSPAPAHGATPPLHAPCLAAGAQGPYLVAARERMNRLRAGRIPAPHVVTYCQDEMSPELWTLLAHLCAMGYRPEAV